jgi:SAM-dependent methyltransferase
MLAVDREVKMKIPVDMTRLKMAGIKRMVPEPLKPIIRNVLDSWAEAVDRFSARTKELVPPATLNRSGDGDFREVGEEFFGYFKNLGGLRPDETVLDVGCGIGRMAVPLTQYLSRASKYEGFDITGPQVRWCRHRISSRHPNFSFRVADIYNRCYNPRGKHKACEYTFVYRDRTFDFVFATSVFTHMLPEDMERYLSEIIRVMKPGARCLITFFLLNPESLNLMAEKKSTRDFAHQSRNYRTTEKDMPEGAVAYDEQYVRNLYAGLGLEINAPIHYGSWCGRTAFLSYQDIVVAGKA